MLFNKSPSLIYISEHGLVWFRALGLGPRDFGGSNPPAPTILFFMATRYVIENANEKKV